VGGGGGGGEGTCFQSTHLHRPHDQNSFLFNSYRGSFPGLNRPRREVTYSPPHSCEVKNEWSATSTPPTFIRGVDTKNLAFFFFTLAIYISPSRKVKIFNTTRTKCQKLFKLTCLNYLVLRFTLCASDLCQSTHKRVSSPYSVENYTTAH